MPLLQPAAGSAAGRRPLVDSLLGRCQFPPLERSGPSVGRVTLAVSGGADSMALLVLAVAAGFEVLAVHVDHGLRPGSAAEATVVAAAATRYGADFEARSTVVAAGPDLEARARLSRYGVLPPGVLTGHTMDDQAETVLLALLRGAGLDGLTGMRALSAPSWWSQGRPGRPLLGLRRSETFALCESEELETVDDPTNLDSRFRRNRVRSEVLPLLSDVAGRDVIPLLARQAGLLGDDAGLLEALAFPIDPTDTRQLVGAPVPLARRAVRRWLRSPAGLPDVEHHPPSAADVTRVLAVADGSARACQLSGGRRIERHGGRLQVTSQ
jgi:tRNA(Ile)-lysidine synthase